MVSVPVSHQPLAAEDQVRARADHVGFAMDMALRQVILEFFGFSLSLSFYRGSAYFCKMNKRPDRGRSSET
jgi:hypothetical protein